ncbi:MAG: peptide ABC transporter substrate-binding protein, partial [Thermoproteota archaeon]
MRGVSKAVWAAVVIIIVIVLAAAALLMQKPAPAPTPTPPPAPPTPKYADTITIGTTDKISDLDPAMAYDFFTWEVFNNVMEGPFKYKPGTTDLEKGIITDYQVQEGGKVYILKLRT